MVKIALPSNLYGIFHNTLAFKWTYVKKREPDKEEANPCLSFAFSRTKLLQKPAIILRKA